MKTITIVLEDHRTDFAARFLEANPDMLLPDKTDFCVELECESGQNFMVSLSPPNRTSISENNRYNSIQSLLRLLSNQAVYAIDTFISSPASRIYDHYVKCLLYRIEGASLPLETCYQENTILIRDEIMAENVITLYKQNKRNIVMVVGANHYGVVYHLLYRLKKNNLLSEVQINVINTHESLKQKHYPDPKFTPLFHFTHLPVRRVEMRHIKHGFFHRVYDFTQVKIVLQKKPLKNFTEAQWNNFINNYDQIISSIDELKTLHTALTKAIESMCSINIYDHETVQQCYIQLLQVVTTKITATPLIGTEFFTSRNVTIAINKNTPLPNNEMAERFLQRLPMRTVPPPLGFTKNPYTPMGGATSLIKR
jgi:hypothetical protein